jgi:hypothetical protein
MSASFTATPMINVSGYKVGRNVDVSLTGSASDTDCHVPAWSSEPDTFAAADAYKWVITGLTTSSPDNLTGQTQSFTTKNGLGTGTIKLKVNDDGIHYDDTSLWMELASRTVQIVDPTNIRIVSQAPAQITVNNPPTEVKMETTVVWQLTYSGTDLPWSGGILEQTTTWNHGLNVVNPLSVSVLADFSGAGPFTADNNGRFNDPHETSVLGPPLPWAGRYHVVTNGQRFKNAENGGILFGSTFSDYEYYDNGPTATHNEF